ncbi:MAG: VanW family protein [Acidimicrobiia bacterium]
MRVVTEVRSYNRRDLHASKDFMNARSIRIAASIAVPALILLLPIAVYLADRIANTGEIPRNVTVVGLDVGGLSRDDAIVVVREYETNLKSEKATFVVSGSTYELDPTSVGLTADVDGAVDVAMNQRSGSVIGGFVPWIRGFNERVDVDLTVSVDDEAIDEHLREWEQEAIENPAYEGSVAIVGDTIDFEYPRIGQRIDRPAAVALVDTVLTVPDRDVTELPLTDSVPELTAADIDEAVATLRRMVSRPILLYNEERNVVLTVKPDEISSATVVEVVEDSPARVEISLDVDRVAEVLEPHRARLELPPVNADFDVDVETNEVTIIPSKNGTALDPESAAVELLAAATSGEGSGALIFANGAEPEFTTADAEAFGPLGLVSEFTTKTPGVERVHNIHLMADTIDGYVVWPGEEFSINEVVGPRTEAKGYKRDGAIINGEVVCCDEPANVGGGVSQYGTTIYNAIFFGCYEDLEHTPHSIYISRYPEGREATLGYPKPDVHFRNDTDAPVIIRNTYDGNSTITVRFYGNNGGRRCEAERSERSNYTDPKTVYEANASLSPGSENVVSKGSQGWTVTVTRVMTMPDGTVIREPYTHRYRGSFRTIERHPCDIPGSGVPCPVAVPGVGGLSEADAIATLSDAGFVVSVAYADVSDATQNGIVISSSPGGSQRPGITITITVGVYTPPADGDT